MPNQGFAIQPVDTFKPINPIYPPTSSGVYKYDSNWTGNSQPVYKGYEGSYSNKVYGEPFSPSYYGGNTTTNVEKIVTTNTYTSSYGGNYGGIGNTEYTSSSNGNTQFKSYLDKID